MFSKEGAFSLVEILIIITVIGVILSLLYNLQLVGSNLWARDANRLELQLNSILFLKRINRDLRESVDISLFADNSILIIYLDGGESIKYFFRQTAIYRNEEKIITCVESTPFRLENNNGLLIINLSLKKDTESYRLIDKVSIRDL
jgi:hypothetical protein